MKRKVTTNEESKAVAGDELHASNDPIPRGEGVPSTGSTERTLTHERDFIENLLNQRFTFFVLFYSLVSAGALAADTQEMLAIVLGVGSVIAGLMTLPLYRVQYKLDLILREIFRRSEHPATEINRQANETQLPEEGSGQAEVPWYAERLARKSRRKLMGYTIPTLCTLSLIIGTVLAIFRVIGPG